MLSNYVNAQQTYWDLYIRPCLFAYSTSTNETVGHSPFYLMYMRDTTIPIYVNFQKPISQYMEESDYVILLKKRLQNAYEQVQLKVCFRQEPYIDFYDKNMKRKIHSKSRIE